MSTHGDGGPAYPTIPTYDAQGYAEQSSDGMTLRDYFAGQALAGIASRQNYHAIESAPAKEAYAIADAMIAERNK